MARYSTARRASSQCDPAIRLRIMASSRDGTSIVKHSLMIAGHSTSVSLEDAFWSRLKGLAEYRGQSVAGLVVEIDEGRGSANLSSAIRVFLLEAAGNVDQYRPSAEGSADAPEAGASDRSAGD